MKFALDMSTIPALDLAFRDAVWRVGPGVARMIGRLEAEPEWDGVSCGVELVGWDRPGMAGYVGWQNGLLSPAQMAAARFVEIPALLAVGETVNLLTSPLHPC